jgi:hypothetical protein
LEAALGLAYYSSDKPSTDSFHFGFFRDMADYPKKSREIENIRRIEEGRGRKRPDSETAQLRRRLERNVSSLLDLSLDEFLTALREDYKLTELQLVNAELFWRQNRGL